MENILENDNMDIGNSKPCFEISDKKILTNLHNAAVVQTAKIVKLKANNKNINQFIINTGITNDGTTIANTEEVIGKARFADTKLEVGIVIEMIDVEDPYAKDDKGNKLYPTPEERRKVKEENKQKIEEIQKICFDGLQMYLKWFAGEDQMKKLTESDIILFFPEYEGGKIKIQQGRILGMDMEAEEKKYKIKLNSATGNFVVDQVEHVVRIKRKNIKDKFKLRVGFKFGYTLDE